MRRRWTVCVLSALLALLPGRSPAANSPDNAEFPLKDVSLYQAGIDIMRVGEQALCTSASQQRSVEAPKLSSKRALFGMIMLERNARTPASSPAARFFIDESQGTGTGYDRLLLDRDGDGNVSQDKPLTALKEAPEGGVPRGYPQSYKFTFFEPLELKLDGGPGVGVHPVKVQPRLMSYANYHQFTLVPLTVKQGEIEYGGKRFVATLLPRYALAARYDTPQMGINLAPADNPRHSESWTGADQIKALRPAGGNWYQLAATPTGDKLIVTAYQGDQGVLKVGAGGRKIDKVAFYGTLSSPSFDVPVGDDPGLNSPSRPVSEIRLPVDNYLPMLMTVQMGGLSFVISDNYHVDGQRQGRARAQGGRPYTITIRKDRPFVLDFSNQPEVIFASPARDSQIRRGEALTVAAVLTDPKLEVMIRRLTDNENRTSEATGLGGLLARTVQQPTSLDPKVVITRANGERVAEGVMPFG